MAIVVEQEKRQGDLLLLVGWLAVIVVILITIFFLFFKKPESLPFPLPAEFQRTDQVSRIIIDPDPVINNSKFKSRGPQVTLPGKGEFGRINPFFTY